MHDGAEQGLKKGAGERERGEGALSSQKMFEQAGLLWRERSSSLAWRGKETTGWMEGAENILRILDQRSALWLLLCLVNIALRQVAIKVEDSFRFLNVIEFNLGPNGTTEG